MKIKLKIKLKINKAVSFSVVLVLCVVSSLWSSTERVDWLRFWSREEQIAYTKGVKDALEAVSFMVDHRVFEKRHAIAVGSIASMEDFDLWIALRSRVEPLLSGAIRGMILYEYEKALRENR